MIKVIDFKPEHIDKIDYKDFYGNREVLKKNTLASYDPKITMTVIDEKSSEIICIIGMVRMWNGVGECWSIMGKSVSKYKFSIVKTLRRIIDFYMDNYSLARLQVSCPSSVKECPRWFQSLKFTYEGRMRKYGMGINDYDLYARVR